MPLTFYWRSGTRKNDAPEGSEASFSAKSLTGLLTAFLLGGDAQRGMRYGTQAFFADEVAGFAAYPVHFVLNAQQRVLQVLNVFFLPGGHDGKAFVLHGRSSIVQPTGLAVGILGSGAELLAVVLVKALRIGQFLLDQFAKFVQFGIAIPISLLA